VPNDQVLRPQDMILVVEITSPGSVTQDTIDKPGEYAAAGVRHYWRVAPEEATVYTFALNPRGDAYQLTGEHNGRLTVDQPVRLDVELADLLRR
ncbi:MAG: Uma2 family endonuclease, partial [Actinobacteria bacterium]|nr:Uma2 family endonuclease [Actinomycetota bacterium]